MAKNGASHFERKAAAVVKSRGKIYYDSLLTFFLIIDVVFIVVIVGVDIVGFHQLRFCSDAVYLGSVAIQPCLGQRQSLSHSLVG